MPCAVIFRCRLNGVQTLFEELSFVPGENNDRGFKTFLGTEGSGGSRTLAYSSEVIIDVFDLSYHLELFKVLLYPNAALLTHALPFLRTLEQLNDRFRHRF